MDTTNAATGSGENQYLTFMLADEEYGVDILKVQELRGWEKVTPIPNTEAYVLGVINLRGIVVPIVDLRRRFRMPPKEFSSTTVVIIVKVKGKDHERVIGIVVDAVSEVYSIAADQLRPAPDLEGAISNDFIHDLATIDDKMVILLDIDRLINEGVLAHSASERAAVTSEE